MVKQALKDYKHYCEKYIKGRKFKWEIEVYGKDAMRFLQTGIGYFSDLDGAILMYNVQEEVLNNNERPKRKGRVKDDTFLSAKQNVCDKCPCKRACAKLDYNKQCRTFWKEYDKCKRMKKNEKQMTQTTYS